jgi:hypothetical protein
MVLDLGLQSADACQEALAFLIILILPGLDGGDQSLSDVVKSDAIDISFSSEDVFSGARGEDRGLEWGHRRDHEEFFRLDERG